MHLKKRDMSLSETYVLAHTARAKLTREAARADHHLRLLVGHANMLDNLMLDLAEAEREREAWYNQAIKSRSTSTSTTSTTAAAPAPVSGKRIQWLDTVVRHDEPEGDSDNETGEWDAVSDSDSDDSSDYETDGDFLVDIASKRRQQSSPAAAAAELYPIKFSPATHRDFDLGLNNNNNNNDNDNNDNDNEGEEEYDDYGDYDYDDGDELTLTRTSSRQHQPPELLHDSDEESEDDMPPSPPCTTFDSFSAVAAAAAAVTAATAPEKAVGKDIHAEQPASPRLSPEEQSSFVEQGFFLPPRNPARTAQTMIAAF
ncbi:conserved hypothetical protein [Trichophyton verrucosum HKI 0517]|uniref:Uncharacterized protein n=1 Tax=Trichophyton verrucosum (strain HKI 0517) TaxID=663202 RepID=D4DFU6_TRIVH|nr:uncharacterized protein TRV_06048 [Trichophyton verrucosum HKI 0517]EFE39276.1 conserved hypothetical protein [Trichophyton verrucosum HKI 0517]